MRIPGDANWPAAWPHYVPLPNAITRSNGPVPNVNAMNWPQSQFAPLYLPAGSPSYQPYSYKKNNSPLSRVALKASRVPSQKALGLQSQNAYRGGPGGDSVGLPYPGSYGDPMSHSYGVVRQGWIPTAQPIRAGIPHTNPAPMPEPIATAGLHSMYGGLALQNAGARCNCGSARMNPLSETVGEITLPKVALVAAALGGIWYMMNREKNKYQFSF